MSINEEYYITRVCPLCTKYNTEECQKRFNQEIQEKNKYHEKIVTIICKDYKNNEVLKTIQNNQPSKMSLQKYYKNYREV